MQPIFVTQDIIRLKSTKKAKNFEKKKITVYFTVLT